MAFRLFSLDETGAPLKNPSALQLEESIDNVDSKATAPMILFAETAYLKTTIVLRLRSIGVGNG